MWLDGTEWNLAHIWLFADWTARGVMLLLAVMFLRALFVVEERRFRYARAARESKAAVPLIAKTLSEGRWDEGLAIAESYRRSPAAAVTAAGLRASLTAPADSSAVDAREMAEIALRRRRASVRVQLNAGVESLATTAYLAPLLGLAGTVHGLWISCLCGAKYSVIGNVGDQFAQALVLAAMGLPVAILATWFHRHLKGRVDAFEMEMKAASLELVNRLTANGGLRAPTPALASADEGWVMTGRTCEVPSDRQRILVATVCVFGLYSLYQLAVALYWNHVAR